MNWEKPESIHNPRPTFQNQNFKSQAELGKVSFTVENKMGNSHKKGWSHFKLNINDSDISFPNMNQEKYFPLGKMQ